MTKRGLLLKLCQIEGVYAPSLYDVDYKQDGRVNSFVPNEANIATRIKKRIFQGFSESILPQGWLVPYIQIVHDRITLEVSRGCPNRCRFCQARSFYSPLRHRPASKVLQRQKNTIFARAMMRLP